MKKVLFYMAFCMGLLGTLSAQNLENSLLWEVSGNGLKHSSFLFGTIHMTCDATIDEAVKTALDNTSLLVLELDMDDPAMQTDMMKGLYMNDNKTLKDMVSEEDYIIISEFVKAQIGMPLDMLGNVKPFFISAMFYTKILDCPVQSYEDALMTIAHEQNEEVLGLETIEEQLSVFDDIPYEDQAADLLRMAKDNLVYDKASFTKMLALYDTEDIEGIDHMMLEDKNLTSTKHRDKMLDNRNKNWISKIEKYSKKQATFYGVGAAHLPGENGVIKLLRKAGYSVNAVN